MCPVLNNDCKLDSLSNDNASTAILSPFMGLCFNNEVYYHLSKGLLPQDLLEMLSNQTELSSNSCIVAPSMYLKQIWDSEADYKQYYKRIFANLHDTFKISAPGSDPRSEQQTVTTDFPEDLK